MDWGSSEKWPRLCPVSFEQFASPGTGKTLVEIMLLDHFLAESEEAARLEQCAFLYRSWSIASKKWGFSRKYGALSGPDEKQQFHKYYFRGLMSLCHEGGWGRCLRCCRSPRRGFGEPAGAGNPQQVEPGPKLSILFLACAPLPSLPRSFACCCYMYRSTPSKTSSRVGIRLKAHQLYRFCGHS